MRVKIGTRIGAYEVEEAIGWGGFATVYRVRHVHSYTLYALKLLLGRSRDSHTRLVTEGRVQSNLKHRNIVHVHEIVDVDGVPGLVMDYFPAPSLGQWLSLYRTDITEAESIFRDILAGVAHAHSEGVVHRDLKPGNVLLDVGDDTITPKVADFGLAKLLRDAYAAHETRTGMTMGTPAYMPPEQLRDAKGIDHRADIWALGCILYELIMGKAPFSEMQDLIRLHERMLNSDWTALPGDIPTGIRTAVARCLAPNRDERPESCAAIAELLGPAAAAPTWQAGAFRAIRVWRSMAQAGELGGHSTWGTGQSPPTMFPDSGSQAREGPTGEGPNLGGAIGGETATEPPSLVDGRQRLVRQLAEMQGAARLVDRELNEAISLSEREESEMRAQFLAHRQRDEVLRQGAIAATAGGIVFGAVAGWFVAEWWGAAVGVLAGAAVGMRVTIPKVQVANRTLLDMLERWKELAEDRREAVEESRTLALRITARAALLAAEATAIAMIPSVPNVRGVLGRVAPSPAPLGGVGLVVPVTPLSWALAALSLVLSASLVAAGLATRPEPPAPEPPSVHESPPPPTELPLTQNVAEAPGGPSAAPVQVLRSPRMTTGMWRGSLGMATLSGALEEKDGVISGTFRCSGRDVEPGTCTVTGRISGSSSVSLVLADCAVAATLKGKLSPDKQRVSGSRTGADGATETWEFRYIPG